MRCAIILSEKSSGSSALQSLLSAVGGRHVARTRHNQYETLFWTKAASVLGLPQITMVDSEIPLPPSEARANLVTLLQENVNGFHPPLDDHELIFGGWRALCAAHGPLFVEKSPHHLCQSSALALLAESIERLSEIDHHLIGLVRNPIDTVYSQWKRWGSEPAKVERQWCVAYRNLKRLKRTVSHHLDFVRYEEMASRPDVLRPILDKLVGPGCELPDGHFHNKSIEKWRQDPKFSFSASAETLALAGEFGYDRSEMVRN